MLVQPFRKPSAALLNKTHPTNIYKLSIYELSKTPEIEGGTFSNTCPPNISICFIPSG